MKRISVISVVSAAVITIVLAMSSSVFGQQAVFSFWGNLVRGEQVSTDLEYGHTLPAYDQKLPSLPAELAAECCSVRPGQTVTLIRGGIVVAHGVVDFIYAARVPRAGDDRTVLFGVTGMPDSVSAASGFPVFPGFGDRMYDMYVVGDLSLEEYEPPVCQWNQDTDIVGVAAEALAYRVVDNLCFPELLGESRDPVTTLDPEAVAAAIRSEAALVEYAFPVAGDDSLTVQSMRRSYAGGHHGFVRVTCGPRFGPVLIRGVLDYFIKVGGIPHMVMRDSKAGTGMWTYKVYRLEVDQEPVLVHADGSWST